MPHRNAISVMVEFGITKNMAREVIGRTTKLTPVANPKAIK